MRQPRASTPLLLVLLLVAFSLTACRPGGAPTPPPIATTRGMRTPQATRTSTMPASPIQLPVVETGGKKPPPSGTLSPQAHLPVVGQRGRPQTPAPSSPTVRPRTPTRPAPTPTPTQTGTVATRRTEHLPYVLGREAPIRQEPLSGQGGLLYAGLLLDLSSQADAPFATTPFTRWQVITRVLPDVLATLPESVHIVPLVMGGTGTCEENLHPIEPLSTDVGDRRAFWTRILASLSPQGRAPLAEAMLTLASEFPETGRRPILLIATGADFCGQDACSVARVLERTESDVSIHVIAVGVPEGQRPFLRCLAESTGGTFQTVSSEGELRRALQRALTHMRGGQLRVEVVGANGRPFFPAVAVSRGDRIVSEFDAWTDADLASGTYSVTVGTPLPVTFPAVVITAGERTRLHIPLGELYIHLQDPEGHDVRGEMTVWDRRHGPFFSVVDREARIPLPTGHYTISVRVPAWETPLAYARDVPVVVNAVQERTLVLPVGRLDVTLQRNGEPVTAFVALAPRFAPEAPTVAGWASGRISFVLPEGTYRLTVSGYAAEGSRFRIDDVPIYAGETWPVVLNTGPGRLRVATTDRSGRSLSGSVLLFPAGRGTPVVAAGHVGEVLDVPAGTYDVRVDSDDGTTLWAWDVDVRAGEEKVVVIMWPQARIWTQVTSDLVHPVSARLDIIRFGDGDVLASGPAPARWLLPPGTYVLRASDYDVTGNEKESEPIVLEAGEAITYRLPLPLAELRIEPVDADRVRVAVFAAGQTDAPKGTVVSYLPDMLLVPGKYDLQVVDEARANVSRWVKNVVLVQGDVRTLRVRFGSSTLQRMSRPFR